MGVLGGYTEDDIMAKYKELSSLLDSANSPSLITPHERNGLVILYLQQSAALINFRRSSMSTEDIKAAMDSLEYVEIRAKRILKNK